MRSGSSGFIYKTYVAPMTGKPASKESIEESKMLALKSLKFIENNWDNILSPSGGNLVILTFTCLKSNEY